MMEWPKTLFLDIDGCIVRHHCEGIVGQLVKEPELLDGVVEKFNEWDSKNYKIILTTGRNESARKQTEDMLRSFGLFWDTLIMGLPRGERVVINDAKIDGNITARGITLKRNEGYKNLEI